MMKPIEFIDYHQQDEEEKCGCMAVWKTRVVSPADPTPEQTDTLEDLRNGAMLGIKYLMEKADDSYVESVRRAKACRQKTQ